MRALEELHSAFVLLGPGTHGKRAKVVPLTGSRIGFAGVEAEPAGFELPNHTGKQPDFRPHHLIVGCDFLRW